jgi:hypothetical protein
MSTLKKMWTCCPQTHSEEQGHLDVILVCTNTDVHPEKNVKRAVHKLTPKKKVT